VQAERYFKGVFDLIKNADYEFKLFQHGSYINTRSRCLFDGMFC
jgi:hypothetical protein